MRIRAIKPEFWKNERMATMPRDVRLLFIGLWNHADDFGRFRAHPALVRGEVFPYDDDADVAAWLQVLVAAGRVRLYVVAGQQYGEVVNFAEHQKIDRRAASRIPAPPDPAHIPAGPADVPAEPAHKPAGPADRTPVDQGSGSRDQVPSVEAGTAGKPAGGRAAARGADPEPKPAAAEAGNGGALTPADVERAAALQSALAATNYRAALSSWARRRELTRRAVELLATGLRPDHVAELVKLDQAKAERPGALLAHWLDEGIWREVLDERDQKQRQRVATRRGGAERRSGAGDYGGAEPKLAASVIAGVLQHAQGGAR